VQVKNIIENPQLFFFAILVIFFVCFLQLSSTDFQHHIFFADYGSTNQNAFAAHILYMWKLELIVHIILYRLLLLAQLLKEKVWKKHCRGLLKDNLELG
jgi:trehalose-6-phosphate synthase